LQGGDIEDLENASDPHPAVDGRLEWRPAVDAGAAHHRHRLDSLLLKSMEEPVGADRAQAPEVRRKAVPASKDGEAALDPNGGPQRVAPRVGPPSHHPALRPLALRAEAAHEPSPIPRIFADQTDTA
jgi:hypothetical protein